MWCLHCNSNLYECMWCDICMYLSYPYWILFAHSFLFQEMKLIDMTTQLLISTLEEGTLLVFPPNCSFLDYLSQMKTYFVDQNSYELCWNYWVMKWFKIFMNQLVNFCCFTSSINISVIIRETRLMRMFLKLYCDSNNFTCPVLFAHT